MGWEAMWLDESYFKVLALVLNGRLVATDHILRTMK